MAANNRSSCTTTGMRVGDSEQSRTPIGRPIPDSPADLAAASPAKLAPDTQRSSAVSPAVASGQANRDRSLTNGMSCNSGTLSSVTAKPVDFKTVAGSYPGDHRNRPGDVVKRSLDACTDNGGPRKPMGQFKNSRNAPDKPGFQSTVMTTGEEAGD